VIVRQRTIDDALFKSAHIIIIINEWYVVAAVRQLKAVSECVMWSDVEHSRAGLEEMTLLLTTAVFLVSCPSEVVLPSSLMTPCVNILRQSWESSQAQVCTFLTA